jgi:quercetin dioxygenase-like cupin family protein
MQRVSEAGREYEEVSPDVHLADLAAGEESSMKHWRIEPGATLPVHRHDNEQIGFLISGELTAILEDEEVTLSPGDSYAFESGELHGAENRGDEPAVGVGVLSPPRASPDWAQSTATANDHPDAVTSVESDD